MRDEGVLIGSEGLHGNILKVRPPIVFRGEHADMTVAAPDRVPTAARRERQRRGDWQASSLFLAIFPLLSRPILLLCLVRKIGQAKVRSGSKLVRLGQNECFRFRTES
jgi:hypothetical protein